MDLRQISQKLRQLRCPEHHEQPTITIQKSDQLKIECCCDKFKSRITAETEKLIREETEKMIDDQLKSLQKLFK